MFRTLLLLIALSIPTTAHSQSEPKQSFFEGIGPATYERQEFEKRKVRVVSHTWEHRGPIGTLQVTYLKNDQRLPYRQSRSTS